MKIVDREKADAYRKEWLKMAELWESEAETRRTKAKTDAAKYRQTHLKAAKDADRDAKHFRGLIAQLDAEVEEHDKVGRLI